MVKNGLATYGIYLPNHPQIDGIERAFADIMQAFEASGWGEQLLEQCFGNTTLKIGAGWSIVARLALISADGVVPPRGIGLARGDTVYLRPNPSSQLVIHELGHRLDFKFGATYHRTTLKQDVPSTLLMRATESTYREPCICGQNRVWGYCLGTRGWAFLKRNRPRDPQQVSGYVPYLPTTDYGRLDHFEDFAESWLDWVLVRSGRRSSPKTHPQRLAFFDEFLAGIASAH